jgi:hypothetical protein
MTVTPLKPETGKGYVNKIRQARKKPLFHAASQYKR